MKKFWFVVRSAALWTVSVIHFFGSAPILVFLGIFLDPRKHDWLQRAFCRRIVWLAGASVKAHFSSDFDPQGSAFFVVNHVNLFDPFVLYCAIPQFVRGWELESHFKIPAYGWLMKRFGNVPVPDVMHASDLKRLWRMTKHALDTGTSLIVFPEGRRTRDGHVGYFKDGVFRMALQLGVPIVPVSIVGSFEHHRTGNWMLWPATITVYVHETIATNCLPKNSVQVLRDRVEKIVSAPVEDHFSKATASSDRVVEASP
jgi:1-acyl-sn-glycerol-3-phosphate acyltransferase